MWYAIIGHDSPRGGELRPQHRAAHLERLERLAREGKLVLAGPFTDGAGSLVVVDVESPEEAWAVVAGDPYVLHGVFDRVEVHPFRKVLPAAPQDQGKSSRSESDR